MNFRIGQEVVCICDDWRWPHAMLAGLPLKGSVYTISSFADGFVRINECPSICIGERCWSISFIANYFRPLVRTDISIFTAMLRRISDRETA